MTCPTTRHFFPRSMAQHTERQAGERGPLTISQRNALPMLSAAHAFAKALFLCALLLLPGTSSSLPPNHSHHLSIFLLTSLDRTSVRPGGFFSFLFFSFLPARKLLARASQPPPTILPTRTAERRTPASRATQGEARHFVCGPVSPPPPSLLRSLLLSPSLQACVLRPHFFSVILLLRARQFPCLGELLRPCAHVCACARVCVCVCVPPLRVPWLFLTVSAKQGGGGRAVCQTLHAVKRRDGAGMLCACSATSL